jgi:hypothetical protein
MPLRAAKGFAPFFFDAALISWMKLFNFLDGMQRALEKERWMFPGSERGRS